MSNEFNSVETVDEVIAKLQNLSKVNSKEINSEVPLPVGDVLIKLGRYINDVSDKKPKGIPWGKISKTLRKLADLIDIWFAE